MGSRAAHRPRSESTCDIAESAPVTGGTPAPQKLPFMRRVHRKVSGRPGGSAARAYRLPPTIALPLTRNYTCRITSVDINPDPRMTEPHQLTELQIAIMRILWERKEATVAEIHGALLDARGLAPTTVA